MADSFAGALGDENPFFLISSLPFVAANAGEARRLYDLAKPGYVAVLKGYNQKLLYSTPWPASGVWAKAPADTPEAVAKLKIRTYDKTGTDLMTALGATASVVSYSDLTAKLKSGVAIDTYDDHRIAMCFSLVSLGGVPVTINDPDCVAKTFPGYFAALSAIS